ncbi:uncharacterized protein LOC127875185 [Dreissena polymorpha]|nr:uncharacterized protein LOC127875185 [Dreissena polymorpha]
MCYCLQKIGRLLCREVEVEEFVVDFEKAMWKALRYVFGENAKIHGCAFHWGQAVWRQVQATGLATEYATRRETYAYIRKIMCLPFLPAEHIPEVFESMVDIAPRRFDGLLSYIRSTWFVSSTWPVPCWSVFGMSIQTNNDVEGWHRRLNRRAGIAPLMYLFIRLLSDEANVALRNVQLVTELQLTRYQRRQQKTMQGQIARLWSFYRRGEVCATALLKQMSTKYKHCA